jgi:gliding motility-associated-like protein
MQRIYFFLTLILAINLALMAQPPVCDSTATMKPTCKEACIICDIDGFKGRNTSTVSGELPNDFCTTVKHNGQWIGFQAGSVDLTIQFTVSNCQINNGLEMGLYEGRDCQNYERISLCDTDVRPNTSVSFSNSKPLIIGQYYWLVIDGSGGDRCDYAMKVTNGTTKIPIIKESGILNIDQITCQGIATPISVTPPLGATEFLWSVNGQRIPYNNRNINYIFDNEGDYEVCVEVFNTCSKGPKTCKKITVTPPPPTFDTVYICPNAKFFVNDSSYNLGSHSVLFRDPTRCDSLVKLTILPLKVEIPTIYLPLLPEVVMGENFTIEAKSNYSVLSKIKWTPDHELSCNDCLTPTLKTIKPSTLALEIWTVDNCYAIDSFSYKVVKNILYYTPNIIKFKSSNNHEFKIQTAGSIKEVAKIQIYDRWGNLLYVSDELNPIWDGHFNGKECEEGIYSWIATLLLYDGSTINITGNLTVLNE